MIFHWNEGFSWFIWRSQIDIWILRHHQWPMSSTSMAFVTFYSACQINYWYESLLNTWLRFSGTELIPWTLCRDVTAIRPRNDWECHCMELNFVSMIYLTHIVPWKFCWALIKKFLYNRIKSLWPWWRTIGEWIKWKWKRLLPSTTVGVVRCVCVWTISVTFFKMIIEQKITA